MIVEANQKRLPVTVLSGFLGAGQNHPAQSRVEQP